MTDDRFQYLVRGKKGSTTILKHSNIMEQANSWSPMQSYVHFADGNTSQFLQKQIKKYLVWTID